MEDDGNSIFFLLPFIADDENDNDNDFGGTLEELCTHKGCKSAIACILDFGTTQWATCQDAVDNNRIIVHGNKNRVLGKGKRFQNEVKDDLLEFFEEMKQFAQPHSTRIVREEAGTELRDGEEDMLELPYSWSKRGLYQRFCGERGWEVKTTARGTTKTTRKAGQELTSKPICHWATFQRFWKREYPLLRFPKPAADI